MEDNRFYTRRNVIKLTTVPSFSSIKGRVNHNIKDVYFVRCIGYHNQYIDEIETMDRLLTIGESNGTGKYMRWNELPRLCDQDQVSFYTNTYLTWVNNQRKGIVTKYVQNGMPISEALNASLQKIELLFMDYTVSYTESIQKNFMVKLLFWIDTMIGEWINSWNPTCSYKIVYNGQVKQQEYLFFYLLTTLGFDVMIMNSVGELNVNPKLLELSDHIGLEQKGCLTIQPLDKDKILSTKKQDQQTQQPIISSGSLKHPKREKTQAKIQEQRPVQAPPSSRASYQSSDDRLPTDRKSELSFEELAKLASSVVMIAIHNKKGDVVGTGSGIMVSEKGYILTNNHVASGGYGYSIRIEDDEQIYHTNEVIKYNNVLDLALIRIDRRCNPLPIYHSSKDLVRGQKVVAIGSPLGLFNSVSNGIISGFRKLDNVDMIQFTAPISHGSSGGALLNMFGEVIGISTAGFDDGQNINLAVDYKWIQGFLRGFL